LSLGRAVVVAALTVACGTPRAPARSDDSIEGLGDGWIGGFAPIADAGGYVQVDFAADVVRLHPRDGRAPAPLIHPRVAAHLRVSFSTEDGSPHELYVVRRDDADERQLSVGLSPVVVETLRTWLAARR
jgi:hypothetical protein